MVKLRSTVQQLAQNFQGGSMGFLSLPAARAWLEQVAQAHLKISARSDGFDLGASQERVAL
jgi:hypothetical protein